MGIWNTWNSVIQQAVYALNQHLTDEPVFTCPETGVEIERTLLFTNTIIPDDPPAKLLLPVPVSLFSVVLEVLFQRRGMLP